MIERIIEWSIRNRFLVIVAAIAVLLWGVYCVLHTPVDAIPDLSENQVIVFTDWMGRSPREIEDQVTYPLSVNLQGLAGVKVVRSSSEFNFSMINIIFDDARRLLLRPPARAGTARRSPRRSCPPGVTPYLAPDATALGQIFWYTVEGEGHDLGEPAGRSRTGTSATSSTACRAWPRSPPSADTRSSTRSTSTRTSSAPTTSRLGEVYAAVARTQLGRRRPGDPQGERRVPDPLRRLDRRDRRTSSRSSSPERKTGTPITCGQLGRTSAWGTQFRRSVLEKDGKEVVGGVVMMRYGENPLEVTRRVKREDRAALRPGCPRACGSCRSTTARR